MPVHVENVPKSTDNPKLTYDEKKAILDRVVTHVNQTILKIKQQSEKYTPNSSKGSENKKIAELEKEISSIEKKINSQWLPIVSSEEASNLINRLEELRTEHMKILKAKKREVTQLRKKMSFDLDNISTSFKDTAQNLEKINAATEFGIDIEHLKHNLEVTHDSAKKKLIEASPVEQDKEQKKE